MRACAQVHGRVCLRACVREVKTGEEIHIRLAVTRHTERQKPDREMHDKVAVGWLLNVPATCECISRMGLLRQLYVLPR